MTAAPASHQNILRWEPGLFSCVPVWTREPQIAAIESLARQQLCPEEGDAASVAATFLAQGAFNKLYTITVQTPASSSSSSSSSSSKEYIFRATLPVEPTSKTASEVATLAFLRRRTTVPVPGVIAYSDSVDDELGCEWILMERIPGVPLGEVWAKLPLPAKETITREVSGYVRQLQRLGPFAAGGNIYTRSQVLNEIKEGKTAELYYEEEKEKEKEKEKEEEEEFVLGPTVHPFLFKDERRLKVPRNRGPYRSEREYVEALRQVEWNDMKLLQAQVAGFGGDDYDEDLAEDAPEIMRLLEELQELLPAVYSEKEEGGFVLRHHDLSASNILIDPATHAITGIVDWECVGTVPAWQDPYPQLLQGPDIDQQPGPLAEGDTDEFRLEQWEFWEKTQLRKVFDGIAGGPNSDDDFKREFRKQLDLLYFSPKMMDTWIADTRKRLNLGGPRPAAAAADE